MPFGEKKYYKLSFCQLNVANAADCQRQTEELRENTELGISCIMTCFPCSPIYVFSYNHLLRSKLIAYIYFKGQNV